MVSVRTSIDDAAVRAALDALGHAGAHMRPAWEDIGESLVRSTVHRFDTERAPDGTPWLPSIRAREQSGQTLTDTARLRGSITHEADDAGVTVGTNVVYAPPHQFGADITRRRHSRQVFRDERGRFSASGRASWHEVPEHTIRLVARPFLGLDADDETSVLEILGDHFRGAWEQGAAAGAPAGVTP